MKDPGNNTNSGAADNRRRAFLASAVRYPALAVLGAVGALLISRSRNRPVEAGQDCINRGLCRGCRVLPGCGLPQASMARDRLKNGRRIG